MSYDEEPAARLARYAALALSIVALSSALSRADGSSAALYDLGMPASECEPHAP